MLLYRTKYFGMLSGIGKKVLADGKVVADETFNKAKWMEKYRSRMQKKLGVENLTDEELEKIIERKRQSAMYKLQNRAQTKHNIDTRMKEAQNEVNFVNEATANGIDYALHKYNLSQVKGNRILNSRANNNSSGLITHYNGKYYLDDKEITDPETLKRLKNSIDTVQQGYGKVMGVDSNNPALNIHGDRVFLDNEHYIPGITKVNTSGTQFKDYADYYNNYAINSTRSGKEIENRLKDEILGERSEVAAENARKAAQQKARQEAEEKAKQEEAERQARRQAEIQQRNQQTNTNNSGIPTWGKVAIAGGVGTAATAIGYGIHKSNQKNQ